MTESELTQVCGRIAKYMTRYGAEIYRVEDTAKRICKAYSYRRPEIYATPANFIITLQDKNGTPVTNSVSVGTRITNLDRVGRLNELSRWICSRRPDKDSIMEKIDEINSRPSYTLPMKLISYFCIGCTSTMVIGGSVKEILLGGIIAVIMKLVHVWLNRMAPSVFFSAFACSAVMSLIAMFFFSCGFVPRFDKMIIGATVTMVPGVAITNGMRDFISGDIFSGLYSMTEAAMTAIGLAVGTGLVLSSSLNLG